MTQESKAAKDRAGRKIAIGDTVEVPHEGRRVITEISARDCGEDDGRTGLPIVRFDCDDPHGLGLFGWEYADAVTKVGA